MKNKLLFVYLALLLGSASAQITVEPDSSKTEAKDLSKDEVVRLDPFVVQGTDSDGYQANSTLAGTRLNTPLKDIASSISVVTRQFLDDTGVKDLRELLVYTAGTEVAGLGGNFTAAGGIATLTLLDSSFNNLNATTRIRGLASGDTVRDYFATSIGFDEYNTENVEINRGANSVLYGLGSPAGIINNTIKKPLFHDGAEFKFSGGSYGSFRGSLDVEKVLIKDRLSVRVAAVDDDRKFQQEPAFQKTRRYFGVVEYRPLRMTTFRVSAEKGDIYANLPRNLPPVDSLTDWFNPGTIRSETGITLNLGPKITSFPLLGFTRINENNTRLAFFYNALVPSPTIIIDQPDQSGPVSSRNPGRVDAYQTGVEGGISRLPGGGLVMSIMTPSAYTARARGLDPALLNFLFQDTLTDTSVFDYRNKLMDGPNKGENRSFDTFDASASQLFLNGNAGVDIAFHYESMTVGGWHLLPLTGINYQIAVDLNPVFVNGETNPNFGRPMMSTSNAGNYSILHEKRNEMRVTPFLKTNLEGKLGRLGEFLGRQMFTAIFSRATFRSNGESGNRAAWDETVGNLQDNLLSSNLVTSGARSIPYMIYLGPSLANASTAVGANLSNIQNEIRIASNYNVKAYNRSAGQYGEFVNARAGVYRDVPTAGSLSKLNTDSAAIVLQNYFYKDLLVGTYGWRQDSVKSYSNNVPGRALDNRVLLGSNDFFLPNTPGITVKPRNTTWGLVLNVPDSLMSRLPFNMEFSPFFGRSQNQVVGAIAHDVYNRPLPPPSGNTKEMGFNLSALERKINIRVGFYETISSDQPITGMNGIINTFISNDNFLVMQRPAVVALNPNGQPDIANYLNAPDISAEIQAAWNFQKVNPTTRNFTAPVGVTDTSDLVSKGEEIELTANLTRNWRVMANVTHQEVIRTNAAKTITAAMTKRMTDLGPYGNFPHRPAPGVATVDAVLQRTVNLVRNITLAEGLPITDEIRAWRFNVVTNYTFSRGTILNGFSVGGGYRWQGESAIGYPVTTLSGRLVSDVKNPYFGPTESAVDAWAGYERKFRKVTWGLKLNVRNVLNDDALIPAGINPDGRYSVFRIPEGRIWELQTRMRF